MPNKQADTKHLDEAARKRPTAQQALHKLGALHEPVTAGMQQAIIQPGLARSADILALQRAAGNRAVSRLIQAKLTVGAPDDQYEQEADRVAERVMSMPGPGALQPARGTQQVVQRQEEEEEVQTKPLLQRQEDEEVQTKPLLQRQGEEKEVQTKPLLRHQIEEEEVQTKILLQRQEDEEEIQTKSLVQRRADGGFDAGPSLEKRLAAQRGAGAPLPHDLRSYMEPRFGADFGGVRLHTGHEAAQLNRALGAQAFTHGKDIYLGERAGTLNTSAGRQLLAHELAHTLQQGASKRVSGWWADSHKMITLAAGYEQGDKYHKDIVEWLADHAGALDITMRSISNFAVFAVFKQRGATKKFRSGDTTLLEKKKLWDEGGLMVRWDRERPFHGEATAYREGADNSDANKQSVTNQIEKAKSAYEKGFYREGLLQLADALHNAEDRGSHGDGMAWSGHDPRLKLPYKWDGSANEKYRPDWDCDNIAKNPGGRELGEYFAKDVFDRFLASLNFESKLKVAMGIGSRKTEFNWFRDFGSRIFHSFRTFGLGNVMDLVGKHVLEPAEDKVRDLEEYQRIKAAYPSIGLQELLELATQGQRGEESKRGFDTYKTEHLKETRGKVKGQLTKIVEGALGDMDPFAMESKYKMFSTLQKTAKEYDKAIAAQDEKSDERTLVSQPIEQDASQWKEKANKYTSLTRTIWRFGRNDEKEALKASIKERAPEHLAFVTARAGQSG